MSEMIERAAQAVDKAISLLKDPVWEDANENRKALCRNAARAAIHAMREPTYGMIRAWSIGIDFPVNDNARVVSWQAMIDEALK